MDPDSIRPHIYISGLSSNELHHDLKYLNKKGFKILDQDEDISTQEVTVTVALTQKLVEKLAITKGIGNFGSSSNVFSGKKYSYEERVNMVLFAVEFILQYFDDTKIEIFLVHDEDEKEKLRPQSILSFGCDDNFLKGIKTYYGSSIALYFGWSSFYTKYLSLPAIAGAYFYLVDNIKNSHNYVWSLPVYCVSLCLWNTFMIESWKRKNSSLAYNWGIYYEDERIINKSLAKFAFSKEKRIGGLFFRFAFTIPTMLFVLFVLIRLMVYYMYIKDHAEEIYGKDSYKKYIPTIVYSIIPSVANFLFEILIVKLTEFEKHISKIDEENHRILKRFTFEFVNRYCAFFYIAFWLKDIARLRQQLAFQIVVGYIIKNALIIMPSLANRIRNIMSSAHVEKGDESEARTQLSKAVYSLEIAYMEIIMEYGLIVMFSTAFPIAPALALLNNLLGERMEFYKIAISRRDVPRNRASLGPWLTCIEVVSFFAVTTNCFLLSQCSNHLEEIMPSAYRAWVASEFGKFVVMVVLEHVLLGVKLFLMFLIDDLPADIKRKLANDTVLETRKDFKVHVEHFLHQALSDNDAQPIVTTSNNRVVDMNQSVAELELEVLRAKVKTATQSRIFSFTATSLFIVTFFPFIMRFLHLPMVVYIPVVFIYLTYYQVAKDKDEVNKAMGIVTNEEFFHFVFEHLPSWAELTEKQRAEWFNFTMQKLWPHISQATDRKMKLRLQPQLDTTTGSTVSLFSLKLKEFSLGQISPKITSITVNKRSKEKGEISFDMDFVWAGNPEILLELRIGHLPQVPCEVCDFRLAMQMRIELKNLGGLVSPWVGYAEATCLKKPVIDLTCKLGQVSMASLGGGDFNIHNMINDYISSKICEQMLFPKKMRSMVADTTLQPESPLYPEGHLELILVSGVDLVIKNFVSSDPFAILSLMDKTFKTKTILGTIQPQWNEKFDFLVYDKKTQGVNIQVYDQDLFKVPDDMGKCILELKDLPFHETIRLEIPLKGVEQGKIIVDCTYTPLVHRFHVEDGQPENSRGDQSAFLVGFQKYIDDIAADLLRDGGHFDSSSSEVSNVSQSGTSSPLAFPTSPGSSKSVLGTRKSSPNRWGSVRSSVKSGKFQALSPNATHTSHTKEPVSKFKFCDSRTRKSNLAVLTVVDIALKNLQPPETSIFNFIYQILFYQKNGRRLSVEMSVADPENLSLNSLDKETDMIEVSTLLADAIIQESINFVIPDSRPNLKISLNVKDHGVVIGSTTYLSHEIMGEASKLDAQNNLKTFKLQAQGQYHGDIYFKLIWSHALHDEKNEKGKIGERQKLLNKLHMQ